MSHKHTQSYVSVLSHLSHVGQVGQSCGILHVPQTHSILCVRPIPPVPCRTSGTVLWNPTCPTNTLNPMCPSTSRTLDDCINARVQHGIHQWLTLFLQLWRKQGWSCIFFTWQDVVFPLPVSMVKAFTWAKAKCYG